MTTNNEEMRQAALKALRAILEDDTTSTDQKLRAAEVILAICGIDL